MVVVNVLRRGALWHGIKIENSLDGKGNQNKLVAKGRTEKETCWGGNLLPRANRSLSLCAYFFNSMQKVVPFALLSFT
jgi:hypothetical protein